MAPKQTLTGGSDDPPPTPSESPWKDWVALTGIVAVVLVACLLAWFYGTSGETSTAGVVALVVPVIGTIVGVVFGVNTGTKAGTAGATALGNARTDVSVHALSLARKELVNMQSALPGQVKTAVAGAHKAGAGGGGTSATEAQLEALTTPHLNEIQRSLQTALSATDFAFKYIGRGPEQP